MEAELVFTGTELLLGQIVNTNAQYLSQALAAVGIAVYRQVTVGDNLERLTEAIGQAAARAHLVIVCGGLGPTDDDLSREALAAAAGRPLEEHPRAWQMVSGTFQRLGLDMPEKNRKQALVPAGGLPLDNPSGTAPGVILQQEAELFVLLPGPPREMKKMWREQVLPFLQAGGWTGEEVILSRTLRLAGIGEATMEERVADLVTAENPTIAPLAQVGEVHLRITARGASPEQARSLLADMEEKVRRRLDRYIYGVDGVTIEEAVGALLADRNLRLAVAESCTGGLLAHRLTNIPGSSAYFHAGFVAYDNKIKEELLGVPRQVLIDCGAVSEEVAWAMATGASAGTGADIGIGITGIAGPDGGSESKPVGLVYTAMDFKGERQVRRSRFLGEREEVKERATQGALIMLWKKLHQQE